MASQAKSLQQLSSAKAIDEFISSPDAESTIRSLASEQQELLLLKTLQECKRLKAVETKYQAQQATLQNIPAVDRFVFGGSDRLPLDAQGHPLPEKGDSRVAEEDDSLGSDMEEEPDPFEKARAFRETWEYRELDADAQDHCRHGALIFAKDKFVSWDALAIGKQVESLPKSSFEADWPDTPASGSHFIMGITHMISSQLLLYRLIATLGPPPREMEIDGYKQAWGMTLGLQTEEVEEGEEGRPKSQFSFYDYKAWASCQFHGRKESGPAALEFLNYLLGPNCAHSYDGVLTGRIA